MLTQAYVKFTTATVTNKFSHQIVLASPPHQVDGIKLPPYCAFFGNDGHGSRLAVRIETHGVCVQDGIDAVLAVARAAGIEPEGVYYTQADYLESLPTAGFRFLRPAR